MLSPIQAAAEALKVQPGMLLPSVARGVVQRRWRGVSAKRPVIPDIGRDPPGNRLTLGQDLHRGVVAVQPLGPSTWASIKAWSGRKTVVQAPT